MLLYLSTHDLTGSRVDFDQVVELADDIAFQASDDVSFAFPFGGSAGDIVDRGLVKSHPHDHGPVDRGLSCRCPP